jgi:hypothetical protein
LRGFFCFFILEIFFFPLKLYSYLYQHTGKELPMGGEEMVCLQFYIRKK